MSIATTMTPEQIANRIVSMHVSDTGIQIDAPLTLGHAIAAAIRAAVEAERESCAALAERLGTRWTAADMDAYNASLGVAGHIRARES